eukprot:scaffold92171_cov21-Tisochrysis_lutea.AAC.2
MWSSTQSAQDLSATLTALELPMHARRVYAEEGIHQDGYGRSLLQVQGQCQDQQCSEVTTLFEVHLPQAPLLYKLNCRLVQT